MGALAELTSEPWPGLAGYPQDPISINSQTLSKPTVRYPELFLM